MRRYCLSIERILMGHYRSLRRGKVRDLRMGDIDLAGQRLIVRQGKRDCVVPPVTEEINCV